MLSKELAVHASVPIEKMSIVLTFETGWQKITIVKLEKIKEEYNFECNNPANSPVTICANDTPIGTGELLDIDGRIGFRVIEFYNNERNNFRSYNDHCALGLVDHDTLFVAFSLFICKNCERIEFDSKCARRATSSAQYGPQRYGDYAHDLYHVSSVARYL
jgi:hypothetical protein